MSSFVTSWECLLTYPCMPSPKFCLIKTTYSQTLSMTHVHFSGNSMIESKIIGTPLTPGSLQLRYQCRLEVGVDTSKKKGTSIHDFFPIDEEIQSHNASHSTEPKIPSNFQTFENLLNDFIHLTTILSTQILRGDYSVYGVIFAIFKTKKKKNCDQF